MPHYVMDPVTERPIAVPEAPRLKGRFHIDNVKQGAKPKAFLEAQEKAGLVKEDQFPCPAPACDKIFSGERAMQTHYGRMHKEHKIKKDRAKGLAAAKA